MKIERWIIKSGIGVNELLYWTGKYHEHCWNEDVSQAKIYNDLRSAWKVIEKRRKKEQWLNYDIEPKKIVLEIVDGEQN